MVCLFSYCYNNIYFWLFFWIVDYLFLRNISRIFHWCRCQNFRCLPPSMESFEKFYFEIRLLESSVTRFGEISPNGKIWNVFGKILIFFLIWQNVEHNLLNLFHYCAHFHCYKGPNIEKKSTHLVTLFSTQCDPIGRFLKFTKKH